MIICEFDFTEEDKKNPCYSMTEIDVYAWIPCTDDGGHSNDGQRNHRLSIRKNIATGDFEAIRVFYDTNFPVLATRIAKKSKTLQEIINFTNSEASKYHGTGDDVVCQHKFPNSSIFCKIERGELTEVEG